VAIESSRPGGPSRRSPGRRRRDRRGRGLRGELAPAGIPLTRTRSEEFDDLILDAVEDLERSWAAELADVEFAVEDVPSVAVQSSIAAELDPEVIDDHGVPLGRLVRAAVTGARPVHPLIVIYRRPLESRALDRDDRADLVYSVVAELVAEALGKDVDEIDPPR
jgi:predicted Zn-dependent protease with MMP-like domain